MFKLANALLLTALFSCSALLLQAQEEAAAEEQPEQGWRTGASFGMDFAQLFQLNPRQGAGQNRLGLGGAVNVFGKYRKNRLAWDNLGSLQFGVQRLGSGVISQGTEEKIPYQKAIDELRFNSKVGYQMSKKSPFFYAADLSFFSQLTPTYQGTDTYPGFFLSDISQDGQPPLSKFLSPATVTFSLGIDFKPNDNWSFFYSPIGSKFIIVGSDIIARRGVHGNPVEGEKDPQTGLFDPENTDNVFSQLGSLIRANFSSNFLDERMSYISALTLYSNYLENPQNLDVDWTNEVALELFKNLQLAMTANLFYDDDVRVLITDFDAPNGVRVDEMGNPVTGKRVSLTQQLLIKYNVVF